MKLLPIPLIGFVIEQERRTTKKGGYFWQVMLRTRVGTLKCFKWDAPEHPETDPKFPHIKDIIEIDSFEDQRLERGNVVISGFHRVSKEELSPEDLLIIEPEKASDADLSESIATIRSKDMWENPLHYEFVLACLDEIDQDKLTRCPAAMKVHHAYSGGLLLHTAEVLTFCKSYLAAMPNRYSFINKDVVLASAILHDIGKIETYTFDDMGNAQQLPVDRIVGHMFYAMSLVRLVHKRFPKISVDFINEVIHCIASHHGKKEWGSYVDAQSIEAVIVSRMDYLSSCNGKMEKIVKENVGQLQDSIKIYGDEYFVSSGIKDYAKVLEKA